MKIKAAVATTFLVIALSPMNCEAEGHMKQFVVPINTGLSMTPNAVADSDDSLIVIGHDPHQAVAIKVRPNGEVVWEHNLGVENDDERFFVNKSVGPEYSGVAVMPDKSIFLCGHMVKKPGAYVPGLLEHLDPAGNLIFRSLAEPQSRNGAGIARLDRCVSNGGGLMALGSVVHFVVPGERPQVQEGKVFWLLQINSNGEVRWESQIPISLKSGALDFGPLVALSGENYVFSATDNVDTEIIRVDSTGKLLERRHIDGAFALIQPIVGQDQIQLIGWPPKDRPNDGSLTLLTLDGTLTTTRSQTALSQPKFGIHVAYELADMSLVLFGFGVRPDGSYKTQILRTSADLSRIEPFDLQRPNFGDAGVLKAVTRFGGSAEFVTATPAIPENPYSAPRTAGENSPQPKLGFALDFFNLTSGR